MQRYVQFLKRIVTIGDGNIRNLTENIDLYEMEFSFEIIAMQGLLFEWLIQYRYIYLISLSHLISFYTHTYQSSIVSGSKWKKIVFTSVQRFLSQYSLFCQRNSQNILLPGGTPNKQYMHRIHAWRRTRLFIQTDFSLGPIGKVTLVSTLFCELTWFFLIFLSILLILDSFYNEE